jgi:hypothetical protein
MRFKCIVAAFIVSLGLIVGVAHAAPDPACPRSNSPPADNSGANILDLLKDIPLSTKWIRAIYLTPPPPTYSVRA